MDTQTVTHGEYTDGHTNLFTDDYTDGYTDSFTDNYTSRNTDVYAVSYTVHYTDSVTRSGRNSVNREATPTATHAG